MKKHVLFSVLIVALLAVSLGAPLAAAQTEPVDEPGLVIVRVDADGPAAKAGVKRGDILLALGDQEINRPLDWFQAVRSLQADEPVELSVLHGDDERTLTATVAERNSRPFLGLQVYLGGAVEETAGEPLLLPLMAQASGAQIAEVVDDSPASAAGLQVGDVITAVDGEALDDQLSLGDAIAAHQPGDEVVLTVTRDDEEQELSVTLGENPDDATRPYLGVRYSMSMTMPDMQEQMAPFFEHPGRQGMPFDLPFDETMPDGTVTAGAVVRTVAEDSPAAEAGIEPGDVITAIDDEAVDGPEALVDAVASRQPGDVVTLTVTRSGEEEPLAIEATLGKNPDDAEKAYLGVSIGAFMMRFQGQVPGNRGGMRFQLPFGLGEMQIDPDQLPFDLNELPFELPFELPGQQQPAGPQA